MQRFIPRRPSGAMLVAFVALFVAMGGSATALKGRNGVKKDDIVRGAVGTSEAANNSLRTQDVRNRTLRDRDMRRNSLTGTSIRESSLGTVPGATNATNAQNANNANNANNAGRAGSSAETDRLGRYGLLKQEAGTRATVAVRGPFTITSVCEAGDWFLEVETSEDDSYANSDDSDDADLDVADPALVIAGGDDEDDEGFLYSPSGWAIDFRSTGSEDDPVTGDAECASAGHFIIMGSP